MASQSALLSGGAAQNQSSARLLRLVLYLSKHILAILITVVAGVFITVAIANHGGSVDKAVRARINRDILVLAQHPGFQGDVSEVRQRLETTEGIALPFWPKHLLYTFRALRLDWGNVVDQRKFTSWIKDGSGMVSTIDSRTIILSKLPNTLLLSGTAFLLLALIGIPAALYLSQHEGNWFDRMAGVFTPLSSVPSWVIGILLVFILAVQLKLFPVGKMFDSIPPEPGLETIRVVAYHLCLPVMAVVLSLFFQLVYGWRTYLLIYADEDYVTLAKAKGLNKQTIDVHYILRPAFPYLVTDLALMLVGFWQMTTALEYFFQWPGIGKLFVDAIPNFNSESMYPGEMSIVIGIAVLFAYLLGITVFILELMYVIFDPRIRSGSQDGIVFLSQKRDWFGWIRQICDRAAHKGNLWTLSRSGSANRPDWRSLLPKPRYFRQALQAALGEFKHALRTICRVPSGIAGLALASLLLIISILVLIYIPYDPVAKDWSSSGFSASPTVAKLALPRWVNWFRDQDLPATLVLNGQQRSASLPVSGVPDGQAAEPGKAGVYMSTAQTDLVFDYPYQDFPSDVALYLTTDAQEKMPFISLTWITPDGREIRLKSGAIAGAIAREFTFPFRENIPVNRVVRANEHLKKWFVTSGSLATPEHYLLFADPTSDTPQVMNGRYTLRIEGVHFEAARDLQAKLVIFGLVEGWAGTDYLRRDLSIPLLWGLPFALFIGVLGAVATSVVALVLAAASAWIGGWVDYLLQRATEINLILPVMAVSVLLYAYFHLSLWLIVGIIMLSTALGNSVKSFRAAFIQEKAAGYIEAAQTYGASDWRIITHYLVRRIIPIVIPQMVMLIPNFVFLEATLAIFNVSDARYPTWGRMVYSALRYGALYGSRFWVLQPLALMLLTGLAFVLIGTALNRVLIPRLTSE